jgi:hypothetical protein
MLYGSLAICSNVKAISKVSSDVYPDRRLFHPPFDSFLFKEEEPVSQWIAAFEKPPREAGGRVMLVLRISVASSIESTQEASCLSVIDANAFE